MAVLGEDLTLCVVVIIIRIVPEGIPKGAEAAESAYGVRSEQRAGDSRLAS